MNKSMKTMSILAILLVLIISTVAIGAAASNGNVSSIKSNGSMKTSGLGTPNMGFTYNYVNPNPVTAGSYSNLYVGVKETLGVDWAKDVTVIVDVLNSDGSYFTETGSTHAEHYLGNVARLGSASTAFTIYVPSYVVPGQKTIRTTVRWYETGWLDLGTFGPYYAYSYAYYTANPTTSLRVMSPNGGENWPADSTRGISWTSTGIVGNVKIDLLKGGVPVKTIVSNTPNNGYYNWIIPATQIPGTNYKVRISSINNPSYVGMSANNFAIAPPKKLSPGNILYSGQTLTSQSGLYKFIMQPDGNLVLYNQANKAIWQSGTTGNNLYAIMQQDGNFVIYTPTNKPKWASNTNRPGSWLIVQNDGNVVIYDTNYNAVWATNTMGK